MFIFTTIPANMLLHDRHKELKGEKVSNQSDGDVFDQNLRFQQDTYLNPIGMTL